jgi:subtilisin family serine protease
MGKRTAAKIHRGIGAWVDSLESRVHLSATSSSTSSPAVDVIWDGQTIKAVAGQYVTETPNVAAMEQLAAAKGFTDVRSLGGNGFYAFDSTLNPTVVARIGKNHPDALTDVEPNFVSQIASTFPNDALAPQQWYLNNTGQVEPFDYNGDGVVTPTATQPSPPFPFEYQEGITGQDDQLTKAWDITTGSSTDVVAILDSGMDTNHPDLYPNVWTNPFYANQPGNVGMTSPEGFVNDFNGWNFVSNNNDVTDDNGHGTNVAGIIGAVGNNAVGVAGIDWNVKLLPVKVAAADGSFQLANEIAGINFVISLKNQGSNIVAINESLGGPDFDVLESAAARAAGRVGILIVAAAGNSSSNNDKVFNAPSNYALSLPNVISVAATDNIGKLAFFSNFGADTVDLAAPGINILSTAPTYDVTLDDEAGSQATGAPQFGLNYGYLSGTSQATPQVTGIIALEAAANPSATPAQLKAALLNGVTYDPYLASANGLPPKVSTSGVANAFLALKNILNYHTSNDTTHLGNWKKVYGNDGAYVVGDNTTFPSFVDVTFDGASPVILQNTTSNVVALQKQSIPNQRIAAYDASANTEAINLDFIDGKSHQVSLYVANLDGKERTEDVQIIDSVTGLVLNTQTVSKLKKGEYLTYDLSGIVQIKLTNVSGPNVVFSGIFFDPVPAAPTSLIGVNTTIKGANWGQQFGSQGTYVVGDNNPNRLPSFVSSFTTTGATTKILSSNTGDVRGLTKPGNVKQKIAAYYYSATSFDINMTFSDTQTHLVTLYAADFENAHRSERISAINPATGAILSSQDLTSFSQGAFVTFSVSGSVTFRVQDLMGKNAVVSGVFVDAPPGEQLSFVGVDTTTTGNWKDVGYGPVNAYVVGDNFAGIDVPSDTVLTSLTGATRRILAKSTNKTSALQTIDSGAANQRIEAYIFTSTSMTMDFVPGDLLVHRMQLYFADYDNQHRQESVTFTDPTTGAVLAKQVIFNFSKGIYYTYDLHGPVNITITALTYPNAVLSGLFTD